MVDSVTYAGTTLAISADLPATNDQAGFEDVGVSWEAGECALHEVPMLAREWSAVTEPLVCKQTNSDIKGSSKWNVVDFKLSDKPGDAAQTIYRSLEASRTDRGSFRMTLPNGQKHYFTAQVAKYALVDGGGQDTIHTGGVRLFIQTEPVTVNPV